MPKRVKSVRKDLPDLRDRMYEPALIPLAETLIPEIPEEDLLDQKSEGACTGFALAATINHIGKYSGRPDLRVSPRMLYEMAKRFDEWDGVDYEGSSIRGAIRGWKNNGVCSEKAWPYNKTPGRLSVKRAKEARGTTVGAYYRLRPEVTDFHAALNEAGVVVCSAQVHSGWDHAKSKIPFRKTTDGGHAFALVGYTQDGFIVQNSWGPDWGQGGLSVWSYEDWAQNLMDGWVVRLALPTPQIFGVVPTASQVGEETVERVKPQRSQVAGHFVHIDDGEYKTRGRYWSDDGDVAQTAELVAGEDYYEHLLFYAHGGLNTPEDSARRIQSMRDGFLRNGIYPYHLMYDTGLVEEFKDLLLRKGKASKERVGGFTDWLDRRTESLVRGVGTRLWEEMKGDAFKAFTSKGAGTKAMRHFLKALRKPGVKKKRIHMIGHSTGGIAIAYLLHAMRNEDVTIDSCTLLAPACRIELYDRHYVPALKKADKLRLKQLQILNLSDQLEQDDNVVKVYRKSLLYLVSNAFERKDEVPLLGMQKFGNQVDRVSGKTQVLYSNGKSGSTTRAKTHGGFDNDVTTMNFVLKSILGKRPKQGFDADELTY